ncbi:hypothetical protein [Bacillus thuringiensis]|uniref:Uncharacterized protein n=1 Tax=Bacillus thuringiensis TaxID=1428 RepID=A0A9X6ZUZ1_BACTU|nr:hypothetical protein [Bacillus thuringiensis]PFJ42740.1 hypothetical protein COJ15_05200 [Bacillus thuringiensis]
MNFEELVFFVAFVEAKPESFEKEELIFEFVNDKLGYSRKAFQTARNKYMSLSESLSPDDILEIKRGSRDFDMTREEIHLAFKRGTIDLNERARRTLICCMEFEKRINEILNEPISEEKEVKDFRFSSLFKNIMNKLFK